MYEIYFNNLFVQQLLEYHPKPWDQWISVGELQDVRTFHAVLSVGPSDLPCLSGAHFYLLIFLNCSTIDIYIKMFAMNKLMLNCSLYQGALLCLPHQTTSAPPPLGRRTATTTTATEAQRTFP